MKSRMKCFSVLALIAFSLGYFDLLVRPCWAHFDNGERHRHSSVATDAFMTLYEWLDQCLGDAQDYFEAKRQAQLRNADSPARNVTVPSRGSANTYCSLCCRTHDPEDNCPPSNCTPQDQQRRP